MAWVISLEAFAFTRGSCHARYFVVSCLIGNFKDRTMRCILALLILLGYNGIFAEEGFDHFYEIAKQNCHDISCIRTEMDRINNELLRLLAERTAYVKRAGDLKSKTTKIADDRQRVADQEAKIIDKSLELGLPIEISLPAFRLIVESSIKFQQDYIDSIIEQEN